MGEAAGAESFWQAGFLRSTLRQIHSLCINALIDCGWHSDDRNLLRRRMTEGSIPEAMIRRPIG